MRNYFQYLKGDLPMNRKKIAVSAKRQMTIPKQFYDELQLGDEVICEMVDNTLVIRAAQQELDFSEQILQDLVKEGYEAGDTMIKEFTYRKNKLTDAVERMIDEERDYVTYNSIDELFDDIMDKDEDD